MRFKMRFQMILLCIYFMHTVRVIALPCDSCGNECTSACGTKQFRTCCFNYLRKRTDPTMQKLSSNNRLIDFILLQGRTLYTQNGLSRDERLRGKGRTDVGDIHYKTRVWQSNGTLLTDDGGTRGGYYG